MQEKNPIMVYNIEVFVLVEYEGHFSAPLGPELRHFPIDLRWLWIKPYEPKQSPIVFSQ